MSEKNRSNSGRDDHISRRSMLRRAVGMSVAGTAALAVSPCTVASERAEGIVIKGRINQSVNLWCFEKYWDVERICQIARQLGLKSVEQVDPEHWPILKKYGLVCALAKSHGLEKGMNNPKYQPMCLKKTRDAIDACAEYGFPNVIALTGFREDIPDDVGVKNCVSGYKKIIGYAEKKKVNLCLENLNTRVGAEMKGHPGYQGDHIDYCMEIVKQVGSPRMKLLFDIYHAQVMDGDIITRIQQYKDYIGHYHTAGNPGRCELDDKQEINYKPIMEEIVKTGFKGYVAQEFIPTRDPLEGLKEAVVLCDV